MTVVYDVPYAKNDINEREAPVDFGEPLSELNLSS